MFNYDHYTLSYQIIMLSQHYHIHIERKTQ